MPLGEASHANVVCCSFTRMTHADRTHVHVTSGMQFSLVLKRTPRRLFSICLDEGPQGFGELVKIRWTNESRRDGRRAVLIQRCSSSRTQQHLEKFDRVLFVRG